MVSHMYISTVVNYTCVMHEYIYECLNIIYRFKYKYVLKPSYRGRGTRSHLNLSIIPLLQPELTLPAEHQQKVYLA